MVYGNRYIEERTLLRSRLAPASIGTHNTRDDVEGQIALIDQVIAKTTRTRPAPDQRCLITPVRRARRLWYFPPSSWFPTANFRGGKLSYVLNVMSGSRSPRSRVAELVHGKGSDGCPWK